MSGFQIGLVILGLLIILILFIKLPLSIKQNKKSSLNSNIEPSITEQAHVATSQTLPGLDFADEENLNNFNIKECSLNNIIDCIVVVTPQQPITGEIALAAIPENLLKTNKATFFSGKVDEQSNWEVLNSHRKYQLLRGGIQLTSLDGIITTTELTAFTTTMQEFSQNLNAEIDLPNIEDEIFRAKIFTHNLIPPKEYTTINLFIHSFEESWTSAFIKQQALQLGFMETVNPNILRLPTVLGKDSNLFYLILPALEKTNNDSISTIKLSLDFYLVQEQEKPFPKMHQVAQTLAKQLNGKIVDTKQTPLQDIHFKTINDEINKRYQKLNSKGIFTGSALAKRLFS